jgi:7-keto-8-aminopelargonate synthetase-like enzyme
VAGKYSHDVEGPERGGVFANPVIPPATTPGRCLIRTSYMATHSDEMLDRALGVIEKAGRKLGVIS